MKILVCDDLPVDESHFVNAIEQANPSNVELKRLSGQNLRTQLNTLLRNADEILDGRLLAKNRTDTAFDGIDLVVLDNNLAHLGIEGARLTAESIAGYIRAFSSAPYIISVNKNPDVDFDLRYLVGDYATRTDLALNLNHLSNRALWTHRRADARDGFLPWYWPKLLGIESKRREQIDFVENRLSNEVCETLGITTTDFRFLSRQARSILSQAEEASGNGFQDSDLPGMYASFVGVFLASSRSLPNREEREYLIQRMNADELAIQAIIARVVAADIDFWFRRDVAGPQEVLVDIPHLLVRMPFLLGRKASDLDSWNSAIEGSSDEEPYGLDGKHFEEHLKVAKFQCKLWSTNPCFWWPMLKDDEVLNSHFANDGSHWIDAVFCEDRSEFQMRNDDDEEPSVSEFVAQFEGAWARRYVANIPGVKYVPRSRFAQ